MREREIKKRLAQGAPAEPPAGLLDALKADIPDDLFGEGETESDAPRDGSGWQRWVPLAASVASVAFVGLLGVALMRQGLPEPAETVVRADDVEMARPSAAPQLEEAVAPSQESVPALSEAAVPEAQPAVVGFAQSDEAAPPEAQNARAAAVRELETRVADQAGLRPEPAVSVAPQAPPEDRRAEAAVPGETAAQPRPAPVRNAASKAKQAPAPARVLERRQRQLEPPPTTPDPAPQAERLRAAAAPTFRDADAAELAEADAKKEDGARGDAAALPGVQRLRVVRQRDGSTLISAKLDSGVVLELRRPDGAWQRLEADDDGRVRVSLELAASGPRVRMRAREPGSEGAREVEVEVEDTASDGP